MMDVEKLAADLAGAMSGAAERINFAMAELRKAGLVAPSNTGTSGYGATGYNGRDPETGRPLCEHNADAETCETEHHYPRFKDYRISRSAHNAHYVATERAEVERQFADQDAAARAIEAGADPVDVLADQEDRKVEQTLREMLRTLDGWIEGAKENHEALDHRNEGRGEECWTQFHPDDIRRMVNDTARALGVDDIVPEPKMPKPREIRKCPTCGVTGGMPHDCETAGRIS